MKVRVSETGRNPRTRFCKILSSTLLNNYRSIELFLNLIEFNGYYCSVLGLILSKNDDNSDQPEVDL